MTERVRKQCAKCPWKVGVNPREIPGGYNEDLHRALAGTIARPGDLTGARDPSAPLRVMQCHETTGKRGPLACVGWLANQLGPGNNIALRLAARGGRFGRFETVGEQHERFEDTLPRPSKKRARQRSS